MADGYPSGDEIRRAREALGWTMAEAVRTLKQRYGPLLPDTDSLVRSWEALGERDSTVSCFYRPLLSELLGLHPPDPRQGPASATHPTAEIRMSSVTRQMRPARSATWRRTPPPLTCWQSGDWACSPSTTHCSGRRSTAGSRPSGSASGCACVDAATRDSGAALRRAIEVGESPEVFDAGLQLAVNAATGDGRARTLVAVELYQYESLLVLGVIAIDDTLYVS